MNAYIAMSGGVDSSVAALLTRDAGHNITGVTLRLHDKQGCGSGDDAQQAADICAQMGAEHRIWEGSPGSVPASWIILPSPICKAAPLTPALTATAI